MYRITYSQNISDAFRASADAVTATAAATALKRRIYRWGTLWGILEGEKWTCERRTQLQHTDECLVESCVPVQCDVLPKEVDDCWEEEYVPLSKGLEYTGLVILKGDARTVLETAGIHGLSVPSLPALPQATTPIQTTNRNTYNKPNKPHNNNNNNHNNHNPNTFKSNAKPRCMIRD